jgi:hypothetical protein
MKRLSRLEIVICFIFCALIGLCTYRVLEINVNLGISLGVAIVCFYIVLVGRDLQSYMEELNKKIKDEK